MIYFGKINALAGCVAIELLFKEIEHYVLIKIELKVRGDLNNAMSTM